MPLIRTAIVSGTARGEVYRRDGAWKWDPETKPTQTFGADATLEDVRADIAKTYEVAQRDVRLRERV